MAAGLGFKTFTTGEVLTAADVNGYLMQGILVFANAAARSSAITSPQEGQYSFLKDTNALEYYDGAAWVGAPVGDITAVNAGTGITGGGASGSVTITNDMATTITAAGDIVVGTGNATYDNLPIGTTGQVLTADTTVSPYKVKWAAASSTPSFAGCNLTKSAQQALTNGAYTNLTFDVETFDVGGYHNNSTNNTRITIPSGKGGYYLVYFHITCSNGDTSGIGAIYLNGNKYNTVQAGKNIVIGNAGISASFVMNLSANDYIELAVYGGATNNAESDAQNNKPTEFGCTLLGV